MIDVVIALVVSDKLVETCGGLVPDDGTGTPRLVLALAIPREMEPHTLYDSLEMMATVGEMQDAVLDYLRRTGRVRDDASPLTLHRT